MSTFKFACLLTGHRYTHKEQINPIQFPTCNMHFGHRKVCGRCGKRKIIDSYVPFSVDKLPELLPRF